MSPFTPPLQIVLAYEQFTELGDNAWQCTSHHLHDSVAGRGKGAASKFLFLFLFFPVLHKVCLDNKGREGTRYRTH